MMRPSRWWGVEKLILLHSGCVCQKHKNPLRQPFRMFGNWRGWVQNNGRADEKTYYLQTKSEWGRCHEAFTYSEIWLDFEEARVIGKRIRRLFPSFFFNQFLSPLMQAKRRKKRLYNTTRRDAACMAAWLSRRTQSAFVYAMIDAYMELKLSLRLLFVVTLFGYKMCG